MNRIGLIAIAAGLATAACDQRPAENQRSSPRQPSSEAVAMAVNPADSWCLEPEALRTEPVGSEAIWARYRHWRLCDYDARQADRYLDILVRRDDPDALHARSVQQSRKDPVESARLMKRARQLGWRERTQRDEMNRLATPPP
ncbi:MAG: hypothetical protein KJ690_03125 [Alphaproteobacteria bacterium]|nr:hypothetical protein [Alphaproteobacteria bacterium]MBU4135393.1 hypothetical protein [Alphaproteobacteria bacterium]